MSLPGYEQRKDGRKPPSLKLRFNENDTLEIGPSGCFQRIMDATENAPLATGLIMKLAVLGSHGKRLDQDASDFALNFVDAMKPEDPAEALLCSQMAAIHQAMMTMARRLNHVDNIPQQDSAERALNKLARTYATQMETLKRYRTKGRQVVRVERVTVEEGGQAIVGNVQHTGVGNEET